MINELAKDIHRNATDKGFWDKERNIGEILMLIVTEISEAMEADRRDRYSLVDSEYADEFLRTEDDDEFVFDFKNAVKDTFQDELADACIRIFDLAFARGIDLEWHIKAKMRYNKSREHTHGKKY